MQERNEIMKTIGKLAVVLGMLALLTAFAVPTFAADTTKQIVIQESDINSSYWVTNPAWRAVTDRSIDLQPGQVVVSETITRRGHDPVAVTITYTPYIENGRLFWTATAMTKDGNPVSDDFLKEINNHMTSSWRHYIRTHRVPGHVTQVDISDSAITITLTAPSTGRRV
jgi:uncharacterized protein YndB with AHSA1/START domain